MKATVGNALFALRIALATGRVSAWRARGATSARA